MESESELEGLEGLEGLMDISERWATKFCSDNHCVAPGTTQILSSSMRWNVHQKQNVQLIQSRAYVYI